MRFVVVGGIAAALHGSTTLTADVDILYDRSPQNIERLAQALAALGARRRDVAKSPPAPVDARAIRNGGNFLLETRAGALNCLAETPSGRFTYSQLVATAERFEVARGVAVSVVSLEELIRMKRATGRPKDIAEVENLAALREARDGR